MKEKKIIVSQIKSSVGSHHVEDRISALEDKRKTLEYSVKVNNKQIFAIVFLGKKLMNGIYVGYRIFHKSPNL